MIQEGVTKIWVNIKGTSREEKCVINYSIQTTENNIETQNNIETVRLLEHTVLTKFDDM